MYGDYFGFRSMPFGCALDDGMAFRSGAFDEALACIRSGLEGGARLSVVTGVAGVGKTVLVRQLHCESDAHHSAIWASADGAPKVDKFTHRLRQAFEAEDKSSGTVPVDGTTLPPLRDLMLDRIQAGRRVLILIDDAHLMPDALLGDLPGMFGLADAKQGTVQLVLFGQPSLDRRLNDVGTSAIDAFIDVRCSLEPMSHSDVGDYIAHRLRVAGHAGNELFTADAVEAIARHARGVPRRIDTLCGISLLIVFEREKRQVTADVVREVVLEQADLDAEVSRDGGYGRPPERGATETTARTEAGADPRDVDPAPSLSPVMLAPVRPSPGERTAFPGWAILAKRFPIARRALVVVMAVAFASVAALLFHRSGSEGDDARDPLRVTQLRKELAGAEQERRIAENARRTVEARLAEIESAAEQQLVRTEQEQVRLRSELAGLRAEVLASRRQLQGSPAPSDSLVGDGLVRAADALAEKVAGAAEGVDAGTVGESGPVAAAPPASSTADSLAGQPTLKTGETPTGIVASAPQSEAPDSLVAGKSGPTSPDSLPAGSVPLNRPPAGSPDAPVATGGAVKDTVHVVIPGDSLWSISQQTGVSVADLRRWNNLNSDVLHVGVKLKLDGVPASTGKDTAATMLAAAASGRFGDVERHLNGGIPVDTQGTDGKSALMHAAINDRTRIARLLLERGASVDLRSATGDTALTYAAWHGNPALLSALVTRGADVDAQNNEQRTALINASIKGNESCVELLLDSGVQVNLRARDGHSALFAAVWNGNVDLARRLLLAGADVNTATRDGWTPLLDAAWNGKMALVVLLLDHGANPGAKAKNGITPLEAARQRGHGDVASVLLSTGKTESG